MNYSTAALVVTYYPDEQVLQQYEVLRSMVDHVIWVDNTPEDHPLSSQLADIAQSVSATFLPLHANTGIAVALNRGIEYAQKEGFDWVLLMDQDSLPAADMVKSLFRSYQAATADGLTNIWAVSPTYHDMYTKHVLQQSDSTQAYTPIMATLTSGMLVNIPQLDQIGLHDESYFIYHVDTEICLRSNHKGFQLIESPDATLYHQEGQQTFHSFLWKKHIITTNHSPFALYYMSRNTVFIVKTFMWQYPQSVFSICTHHYIVTPAKILLFEEQKLQKLYSVIRGLLHGLLYQTNK